MGVTMKQIGRQVLSIRSVLVLTVLCSGFYFLGMWCGYKRAEDELGRPFSLPEISEAPAEEPDGEVVVTQDVATAAIIRERMLAESEQKERLMRNISENLESSGLSQMMRVRENRYVTGKYSPLFADFNLNEEERNYFSELLLARQMAQVDLGMKLMTGLLTDEEVGALRNEVEAKVRELNAEIDWFLNNEADSEYFQYYDQTELERLTVFYAGENLRQSGMPLEEGVGEELVGMMYDQITTHDFSVDFENDGAPVVSEYTTENIDTFVQEMKELRQPILDSAAQHLSPEQTELFAHSFDQYVSSYEQRLRMQKQIFNPES